MLNKLNKIAEENKQLLAQLKANIMDMEDFVDEVSADDYPVALVQYNQMRDAIETYELKAEYYTRFVKENIEKQDISDKYTTIELNGVKQYVKKDSAEELQNDFIDFLQRTGRTEGLTEEEL